jgi:Fe-S cluster assembly scaffold protein SufB
MNYPQWLKIIRKDAGKKIPEDFVPFDVGSGKMEIQLEKNIKRFDIVDLDSKDRNLAKSLFSRSAAITNDSNHLKFILANFAECSVFMVEKGKSARLSISHKGCLGICFVLLSENSSITIQSDAKSDCMGMIDIFGEERSKADIAFLKQKGCKTYRSIGARLKSNATLNSCSFWSGNGFGENKFLMEGTECSVKDISLSTAGDHEKLMLKSTTLHNSNSGKSRIVMRSVAEDNSEVSLYGKVRISNAGRKSESNLSQEILLLDKEAKADARPIMEILNNDVECTHSASVRSPDEEKMFYLMSRGLDRNSARTTMMTGFLRSALDMLENRELTNMFMPPFMR